MAYNFIEVVYCNKKIYLDRLDGGGIHITDTDGLRKAAEVIINAFDTKVLEAKRKEPAQP